MQPPIFGIQRLDHVLLSVYNMWPLGIAIVTGRFGIIDRADQHVEVDDEESDDGDQEERFDYAPGCRTHPGERTCVVQH